MKIIDAIKLVQKEKGMLIIRNPIKKGERAIEFVRL